MPTLVISAGSHLTTSPSPTVSVSFGDTAQRSHASLASARLGGQALDAAGMLSRVQLDDNFATDAERLVDQLDAM